CGLTDGTLMAARFGPGAHGNFAIDRATGLFYVPDAGEDSCSINHVIRKIDIEGNSVLTVAGGAGELGFDGDGFEPISAHFNTPHGTMFYAGKLYVADTGNNRVRVIDFPMNVIN